MKSITLPLTVLICFVISCGNHSTGTSNQKSATGNSSAESPRKDSTKWIDSFRAFRDAVYQRDKEKVKQFFDFPVNNNNEIWDLVTEGADDKMRASDSSQSFTEKDFDKYFDLLFPKRFINCLLKIKSEELWKTGRVTSKEIKDGNTTYVMYATYESDNKLTLNLNSNALLKQDDGEIMNTEFSEIYEFTVLSNGKIKFSRVMLAG